MTAGLRVEVRDGHQLWTLDRPARRNALDLALLGALGEARDRAVADGCSVVVLAASGDVFCAGFDLGDLRRLAPREGVLPASPLHDLLARFEPPAFTLITAIQGPAHGGGVELALLGDLRVASPRATFTLPPARLGITYPAVGIARLQAALGPSLLRAMLVSARPVEATRLWQQGALWSLADAPVAAALSLAAEVSALPAAARLANAALLLPRP